MTDTDTDQVWDRPAELNLITGIDMDHSGPDVEALVEEQDMIEDTGVREFVSDAMGSGDADGDGIPDFLQVCDNSTDDGPTIR